MKEKWLFQMQSGAIFGQEGTFSLGWGGRAKAKNLRVFCADLTERKVLDLVHIRPRSWSPIDLLTGSGWHADLILSEPIRHYELDELKGPIVDQLQAYLRRVNKSRRRFGVEMTASTSFDEVYNMLRYHKRQPEPDELLR